MLQGLPLRAQEPTCACSRAYQVPVHAQKPTCVCSRAYLCMLKGIHVQVHAHVPTCACSRAYTCAFSRAYIPVHAPGLLPARHLGLALPVPGLDSGSTAAELARPLLPAVCRDFIRLFLLRNSYSGQTVYRHLIFVKVR